MRINPLQYHLKIFPQNGQTGRLTQTLIPPVGFLPPVYFLETANGNTEVTAGSFGVMQN